MNKNENKLKGRDLINVGIYSAIYFVIMMAVAMLGMIPIFLPLLSVIVPILGGIPFMLFLTKVKKPGMLFLMAMIMGIMMLLTGMGPWPLATCAVAGLLAELVYRSGDYKSAKKAVLTHGVFSMWIWGNYLPLFTDYEGYFAQRQDYGQAYIDAVEKLMPLWMAPVLLVACFVCGILGGLLGRALLKKHFAKAGIV
ncbi:MAG: MptD family putative ECF transporter S component [Oscillospiraceae bacterium]|nr:MptD family putative ECF transporter S component [Oscillospiraceae bacterium]